MNRLPIPNTGDYLYVDDIVILASYPGTRYVTRCGWFTLGDVTQYGWYFQEIESYHIILASADVVAGATKVGQTQPSFPQDDISAEDRINSSNANIVLDSIEQRDALSADFNLPDGKLVFITDQQKSYRYNRTSGEWVEVADPVSKEYVDEGLALKEDIANKVTALLEGCTDDQYPSALAVLTAIQSLNSIKTITTAQTYLDNLSAGVYVLTGNGSIKIPSSTSAYKYIEVKQGFVSYNSAHFLAYGQITEVGDMSMKMHNEVFAWGYYQHIIQPGPQNYVIYLSNRFESIDNKVEIISDQADNDHYPTALAVLNLFNSLDPPTKSVVGEVELNELPIGLYAVPNNATVNVYDENEPSFPIGSTHLNLSSGFLVIIGSGSANVLKEFFYFGFYRFGNGAMSRGLDIVKGYVKGSAAQGESKYVHSFPYVKQ